MKKTSFINLISAAFVFISGASSFAVDNLDRITSEAILNERAPVITFGYLMQVFFSLLIVAAFLYIAAKYVFPKLQITGKGKLIEVVDRLGLEPQVSAFVLRVNKRAWLVVASSKNVQVISELEESDYSVNL